MTGSELLKAVRNGFVHARRTSQARRFGSDAGSSGEVGTSSGNRRAPSLYESSGKGASEAPMMSSGRSVTA